MKEDNLHIGQLVKNVVRQKGLKDVDFAKKICRSKQNVYDMYKRIDMEVKLLLTCSKALNHNFFNDIYPSQYADKDCRDEQYNEMFDALCYVLKDLTKKKLDANSSNPMDEK